MKRYILGNEKIYSSKRKNIYQEMKRYIIGNGKIYYRKWKDIL